MIKSMLFILAAMVSVPTLAQDAAPTLPFCSAKVTDNCQQTKAQQARAMTGEQADRRDAANGGAWTPDKTAKKPMKKAPM